MVERHLRRIGRNSTEVEILLWGELGRGGFEGVMGYNCLRMSLLLIFIYFLETLLKMLPNISLFLDLTKFFWK